MRDGRVLIERRRDDARSYPGVHDSPGGHLEPGESPEAALIREMREELGIELTSFFLGRVVDDLDAASGRLYRHYIYVVTGWSGDVTAVESQSLRWIHPSEATSIAAWNPLALASVLDFDARGWFG